MTDICPACEKGVLAPSVLDETLAYAGDQLIVRGIEFSMCPVCDEEVVLPAQARRNELRFADAKRSHDNLLRSDEIVAWRSRWGLTQQQAAALLGGGVNAFSKYERGEVIQSYAMDLLIRASDRFADLREFLGERAGLEILGGHWEPLADERDEVLSQPRLSPASESSIVVDIMAYRIRETCETEAHNDGEWHVEPEYAYGR